MFWEKRINIFRKSIYFLFRNNHGLQKIHAKIFEGNGIAEWGDIGTTIIIDAATGVGGFTDWTTENSFLRQYFYDRDFYATPLNLKNTRVTLL